MRLVTTLPYRIGISHFTTNPWSFEKDARLGVGMVEVREDKQDEERFEDAAWREAFGTGR